MTRNKPKFGSAKSAGGTVVNWGRDEEYVSLARLDDCVQANLPGICSRCEKRYASGDWIFRGGEDGSWVGVNCCATQADTQRQNGPVPLGLGDLVDVSEEIEGRDFVPLSQVMPKGKTKRDMCPRCFQIPASNGVCGC